MSKKKKSFLEQAEKDGRKRYDNLIAKGYTPEAADKELKERTWISLVIIAVGVAILTAMFVKDHKYQEQNREARAREQLRANAAMCQELFAYWEADILTDKQRKKVQECITMFGSEWQRSR
ncbi:MAG: hypothetical protein OXK72_01550 [Gammaproteobacteria bacterium]|nr:hypothetical protein [Gammaproteobacteria bacterium]MDE0411747.1 hypothetical protein [Gammaproteobacteria bacterium]